MNHTWHGVYKGPIPRLAGKGALLRIKGSKLFAQFDDIREPEAYGWTELPRCDFKIRPRGRGALWSNRYRPVAGTLRKAADPAVMYASYSGDKKATQLGLGYSMGALIFFSNPSRADWVAARYNKP